MDDACPNGLVYHYTDCTIVELSSFNPPTLAGVLDGLEVKPPFFPPSHPKSRAGRVGSTGNMEDAEPARSGEDVL